MASFEPRLSVLPPTQRRLWPDLKSVPKNFVLYGGTGLALRLGHRQSIDFDFFSSENFMVADMESAVPLLRGAERLQAKPNTLTVMVDRNGPVKLSFFGGLKLKRVQNPEWTSDGAIQVA